MTDATHTPGPWEVLHDKKLAAALGKDVVCRPTNVDVGGIVVAGYIFIAQCERDLCAGTAGSNARLIAAAPDLLQSLRNIVTLFEGDLQRGAPGQLEAARAAIAKAEGRDD